MESGSWISTFAAGIFIFFGSGVENVFVAFQITFVGALAFGLGQLLLADHDAPLDRRDWLGLLCGFASIMCSAVGLTMVFVVGLAVLLRRGWRLALFHTAPLAIVFVIWLAAAPSGQSTAGLQASSLSGVLRFVAVGLKAAFLGLGQLRGVGYLIVLVLVVGLVLTLVSPDREALRGPAAAPLALLVGAIVFLVVTGMFRSGVLPGVFIGPNRARLSRYVYIVGALAMPAVAFAVAAIHRRWPRLTVAMIALLAIGIPGNITNFIDYRPDQRATAEALVVQQNLLAAAHDPLATQLPRSLRPEPGFAEDVTIGWLLDSRRSGRIPSPKPVPPNQKATATLALVLQASPEQRPRSCRTLVGPTELVLHKGDSLTARTGAIDIIYLPVGGARSDPRQLSSRPTGASSKTVIARAGPLRLVVSPTDAGNRTAVVCT